MDFKSLLKNKWLVVLAVIGVACLLFGSLWSGVSPSSDSNSSKVPSAAEEQPSAVTPTVNSNNPVTNLEQVYDTDLQNIISSFQGVHSVNVMVTLDNTQNLQVATDTSRTDTVSGGSNGQHSTTTQTNVYTDHNADGSSTPFVIEQQSPTVRGVLVSVNADDFYTAKAEIIDGIQHVLDVPAYKITVEPKKDNQ